MSASRPLVLDKTTARIRELRKSESIPLEQRVEELEKRLRLLKLWMIESGFDLPGELLEELC